MKTAAAKTGAEQRPGKQIGKRGRENLARWRESLNGSRLPIFARTVKDVKDIAASRATSARDLSEVVGHDASMAARVIQIANSPLFNLQNKNIDTINAAVVMVGFDAVREIAISVGIVEEMLKGYQHERVGSHLSRAFHAAAQARSFANLRKVKADEVFVAGLLHHVGAMAFWSRAEREAVALEAQLQAGVESAAAEREILGFELSDLSRALAEDWQLGDLVAQALNPNKADQDEVQDVLFGHRVAEVLETHGWDSAAGDALKSDLAKHLQIKPSQLDEVLAANFKAACGIAERFGVEPVRAAQAGHQAEPADAPAPTGAAGKGTGSARDAQTFLQSLLDIGTALEEGASRDELMRLALSGLHQGLGLRLAFFALLNPQRDRLTIKYAVGEDAEPLLGSSLQVDADPLLLQALQETRVIGFDAGISGVEVGGDHPGAIVATRIGGKSVGLLYGELEAAGAMDSEQMSGFRQIGQQIGLILVQSS